MSELLQPASLASWPELGAELPASKCNLRMRNVMKNRGFGSTGVVGLGMQP
jgi:hypothetical protein